METLKIIFILTVLIIMIRKRLHLGHAFLITACLFGLLHQIKMWEMVKIAYSSLLSPASLIILGSLLLINILEKIISETGMQTRLVTSIRNFTGDPRAAMVILPGLIGLLPSPGGAVFSAPMVKEASRELHISPERSAAINFYFRHIWEFFLPLYPANLIAAQIIGVPLNQFIIMMFPFMPATVLMGLILFHHVHVSKEDEDQNIKADKAESATQSWLHLCEGLLPIVAILLMVIIFKLNILLALTITISVMFLYYRIPFKKAGLMVKKSLAPGLFYMTFASLYLSDVLQQSGSIEQILSSLLQGGLNPLVITLIFPFFIGLLTGITLPGITIAIPIILTLAGPNQALTLSCLAFMSTFIGVMLSPTHLCLILSVEYFAANFAKTFRHLFIPETTLMLFSILYCYLFL